MLLFKTNPLRQDKECFEVEGKEQFLRTVLYVFLQNHRRNDDTEAFTKRK